MNTLSETGIAPENGWLEYKSPFEMAYFQGQLLVLGKYIVRFVCFLGGGGSGWLYFQFSHTFGVECVLKVKSLAPWEAGP